MSRKFYGKIKNYFAFATQEINESLNVLRSGIWIQPPQSDVEEIPFAKTPAIALKILAKIELWCLRLNRAKMWLLRRHLKFYFLGYHRFVCVGVAKVSRHRTEMPSSSNQQFGSDFTIDNPVLAGPFDLIDGDSLTYLRSRPAQQVVVKLTATDTIADGVFIQNCHFLRSHRANAKPPDGLHCAARGIIHGIDFQQIQYPGRDPPSTYFVSRKYGFVQDYDTQSGSAQGPGA